VCFLKDTGNVAFSIKILNPSGSNDGLGWPVLLSCETQRHQ